MEEIVGDATKGEGEVDWLDFASSMAASLA